jgi:hypothetical protein
MWHMLHGVTGTSTGTMNRVADWLFIFFFALAASIDKVGREYRLLYTVTATENFYMWTGTKETYR